MENSYVDWIDGGGLSSSHIRNIINDIYDDIGTCGECKYCKDIGKDYIHCTQLRYSFEEDWYCKDFERKTDD